MTRISIITTRVEGLIQLKMKGSETSCSDANVSKKFIATIVMMASIVIIVIFGIPLALSPMDEKAHNHNAMANHLKNNMRPNIGPCENFQAHFGNNDPKYFPNTIAQNYIIESIEHRLMHPTENEPKAMIIARTLFNSCMRTEYFHNEGIQAVIKTLRDIKLPLFPAILDSSVSVDAFNMFETLALAKRKFNFGLLFQMVINRYWADNTKKEVELTMNEFASLTLNDAAMNAPEFSDIELDYTIETIRYDLNDTIQLMGGNIDEQKLSELAGIIVEIDDKLYSFENVKESNLKSSCYDLSKLEQRIGVTGNGLHQYVETLFGGLGNIDLSQQPMCAKPGVINYLRRVFRYIRTRSEEEIQFYIWYKVVNELMQRVRNDESISHSYTSNHCVKLVNYYLPYISARAIAEPEKDFERRNDVKNMFKNLKSVLVDVVKEADWMDAETKNLIIEKIEAIKINVGYPEWILNDVKLKKHHEGIKLNDNTFLANIIELRGFNIRNKLELTDTKETNEWTLSPTKVNANYGYTTNTITLPLAYLRPPYYLDGLKTWNYGTVGWVIAHEIAHAIDTYGLKFNKYGNRRQWLDENVIKKFREKTHCFVQQYGRFYSPETNSHINGLKSLDENIADNVGLHLALKSLRKEIEKNMPIKFLPGFEDYTSDQQLLLASAYSMCGKQTESKRLAIINSDDPHIPDEFRLNGAISNLIEFQKIFNCPSNSKMVTSDRCHWL